MNTQSELEWLASLEFFGIKLGLEQTEELFRRAGNPHHKLKLIHVAGSNGKGSVCAFTEAGLRAAGWKTGFYSSPHLVRPGERFRINGVPCPEERLAAILAQIRPLAQDMAKEGKHVTYFEVTTLAAALLFAEGKVDFALWETGMGGRLDATNIVLPELSVITGISMEHSDRLGDTLAKIAFEKAGIIKRGIPVFCSGATPPEALEVIRARADEMGAECFLSDPFPEGPLQMERLTASSDAARRESGIHQKFPLKSGEIVTLPLAGPCQRRNAALSAEILRFLSRKYAFDFRRALDGFAFASWPARMQFFPELHLVMDAAHNPEGVESLRDALRELHPGKKFHFIFGAFSDKDFRTGLEILAPMAKSFRFVSLHSHRSSRSTEEMAAALREIDPSIPSESTDLTTALFTEFPAEEGEKREKKVLCGSLHLCGEALEILENTLGKRLV